MTLVAGPYGPRNELPPNAGCNVAIVSRYPFGIPESYAVQCVSNSRLRQTIVRFRNTSASIRNGRIEYFRLMRHVPVPCEDRLAECCGNAVGWTSMNPTWARRHRGMRESLHALGQSLAREFSFYGLPSEPFEDYIRRVGLEGRIVDCVAGRLPSDRIIRCPECCGNVIGVRIGHSRTAYAIDCEDCENREEEDDCCGILGYHERRATALAVRDPNGLDQGIELECEVDEEKESQFVSAVRREIPEFGESLLAMRDGSIGSDSAGTSGIEFVFGYGSFLCLVDLLRRFLKVASRFGVVAYKTAGRCGLHVSVCANRSSTSGFNALARAKFVMFFNSDHNRNWLNSFAKRNFWSGDYSVTKDTKRAGFFRSYYAPDPDSAADFLMQNSDKYDAVNTRHSSHVEVRIFRGTMRRKRIEASIALCGLVAKYCSDPETTIENLTYSAFLDYFRARPTLDKDRWQAVCDHLKIESGIAAASPVDPPQQQSTPEASSEWICVDTATVLEALRAS